LLQNEPIGVAGLTKMRCTSPGMVVQESACPASLIRAATFTIIGNRLVLADENGTMIHSYRNPDGTAVSNLFSAAV